MIYDADVAVEQALKAMDEQLENSLSTTTPLTG